MRVPTAAHLLSHQKSIPQYFPSENWGKPCRAKKNFVLTRLRVETFVTPDWLAQARKEARRRARKDNFGAAQKWGARCPR